MCRKDQTVSVQNNELKRKRIFPGPGFAPAALIPALFLAACTEIINVDLNSSDPQIVIEGNVSTAEGKTLVSISETVNFDESNTFPKVQGAHVELTNDAGQSEVLPEIEPGIYRSPAITGKPGRTYFLTVQTGDRYFSSVSQIPALVRFDSLIVTKNSGTAGFGEVGYTANYDLTIKYRDPPDEPNYYRFVEIVNGEPRNGYVFDDRLNNGKSVTRNLIDFQRKLEPGDVVTVEMQCIDKAVYKYFNSFTNLRGGPGVSATPANPYTNINGAVLGYFSAHTSETLEVLVK